MPSKTSEPITLFEFQQSLLAKEIEYIHSQISSFDTLSFQIKGWAVTLWAGITAYGSSKEIAMVVLASIPVLITFWIIDAFFKQYQHRCMSRMGVIEKFLDSRDQFKETGLRKAFAVKDFGDFPIHDPIARRTQKLDRDIAVGHRRSTSYWRAFFVPNVALFYSLLTLCSLGFVLAIQARWQ